ncbi:MULTISPECIES: type II toxin-antitoxin system HicA family toxin [Thomasclavelia]|nr:type II toxin-antitoxin system HicA family toxin [Thomasclavelia ramosa]MCQ5326918.1 type II toxin-antitoxin system HicA family toxin [Thomasclavelia ramosa]MDO5870119.1 type II toxin-antitoxin system HicA family toxin [Thomasclavelia ramosa]MDO5873515.1 type II toxin-antitoxin system HicA family toxin [Thomasclavelia ramosa]MDO5902003.1 type II toxin-antitoxin system HicA family toxin [Thomasclavelia ramosa]MDY4701524.1 type II toxin-antitoxin system HicA family toxin [Thomasclavelia ramos
MKLINHETGKRIVAPVHGKDLKKGLEKAIIKQAGLSK